MVNINITEPGPDEDPKSDGAYEAFHVKDFGPKGMDPQDPDPGPMSRRDLALLILQYEDEIKKADQTAKQIQAEIMTLAESVTVGSVTAKYSKGRATLDWESPVRQHDLTHGIDDEILEKHSTWVDPVTTDGHTDVDYKSIANDLEIDPRIVKSPVPSVKMVLK